VFEPAVREGSAVGRERARTGELARDAAAAARGRRLPEQRRRTVAQALAAVPAAAITQANRDRARRHLARVAADVAQRNGYPDIGTFVLDQVVTGLSLAAISRRTGLDKDWLSRHLADLDPVAAAAARQRRPARWDTRWLPALRQLGFPDVASYLHERTSSSTAASTPSLPRSACHTMLWCPRCAGTGSPGQLTRPGDTRPGSAPCRSPRASALAALPTTSAAAGQRGGPGGPFPRNPGSHSRGYAGTTMTRPGRNQAPSRLSIT
jgi:hypothetical protein